ncbi:MAG TPA: carboxypeptidase-like regulatory domain-containing protein [Bryobacteraceae bacterium]|nr:carboxypeptidase-like regulatory domain-containing protein [Bryobacteraceae bacterium]
MILLFAGACFARQDLSQATPQPQAKPPRRTVTGTVTNAVSGEPIRRALVQLNGAAGSVLTGADGRFEFHDIPEGPANLSASKPGFFEPRSMPSHWAQPESAFIVGSGANDFALKLFPEAKITGRVTSEDGVPIEGAQIQVLSEQLIGGRKQWQLRSNANTDDDGSYRMSELIPGRYLISAMPHLMPAPAWDAPKQVTPVIFYPAARQLNSAQTIDLEPGQEFRADFRVPAERAFRVTGRFQGFPATGSVSLRLLNSTGQDVISEGTGINQNRGTFLLQAVPPGIWTVLMNGDGAGPPYEGRQEITVSDADISNVAIVLHPGNSIPVIISRDTQTPTEDPGFNATLMSISGYDFREYGMTRHSDNGPLFFENIGDGKYKLRVQSFGSECIESARYGNVDLLREFLVVDSDQAVQTVTLKLGRECGSFNPRVSPEQPTIPAFFVLIVPDSPAAEPQIMPIAEQSAGQPPSFDYQSFKFPPGSYQVYGFTTLDGLEYANPEVLREYPGQTIELAAGQKAEFTVKLSRPKSN